jgi:predicted phage-related endonuclease
MIRNEKVQWAHASLDGELIDREGRRGILEIKTTNILQSMQREKWKDQIPDNYYIQVLHYLLVTEYEFVVLKAQLKSEWKGEIRIQARHYFIEREDVLDDIAYLQKEEEKFWRSIEKKRRPGLLLPSI